MYFIFIYYFYAVEEHKEIEHWFLLENFYFLLKLSVLCAIFCWQVWILELVGLLIMGHNFLRDWEMHRVNSAHNRVAMNVIIYLITSLYQESLEMCLLRMEEHKVPRRCWGSLPANSTVRLKNKEAYLLLTGIYAWTCGNERGESQADSCSILTGSSFLRRRVRPGWDGRMFFAALICKEWEMCKGRASGIPLNSELQKNDFPFSSINSFMPRYEGCLSVGGE